MFGFCSDAPKKTITITMEGGLIQWISNIPDDVIVEVRDYDVDYAEEDDLSTDEDGNKYTKSFWTKEGSYSEIPIPE